MNVVRWVSLATGYLEHGEVVNLYQMRRVRRQAQQVDVCVPKLRESVDIPEVCTHTIHEHQGPLELPFVILSATERARNKVQLTSTLGRCRARWSRYFGKFSKSTLPFALYVAATLLSAGRSALQWSGNLAPENT